MKKKLGTKKRQTLPVLLAKSLGMSAVLSLLFGAGFHEYIVQYIRSQADMQIEIMSADTQQQINKLAAQYEGDILMQEISCRMAMYSYYDIMLEDPLARPDKSVQLVPKYSPKCHSGTALVNENGEIVASNKRIWMTHLIFSDDENDPAKGWYVCDREKLSLPEVDQLYADYRSLSRREDMEHFVDLEINTAYVNRETHSFIPQKGKMMLTYYPNNGEPLIDASQKKTEETKEINIQLDLDGYELVTLHYGPKAEYPRAMLTYPQGEDPEDLKQFESEFIFRNENSYTSGGYQNNGDGTATISRNVPIYVEKQPYWLTLCFTYNMKDPQVIAFFWRWTVTFAVGVLLICLLWCWRQNTVNKTKYAFEDYQRDLTNHLAHDIKTPLTAIGGYTENLMEGQLTEDEQQRYLQGILDNVAFTDSIISRTLNLNSMDSSKKPVREKLRAESVVEAALAKYKLLLEEKHILYSVQGSAEIKAERAAFETIVENLISNAVKYTPENGSVKAVLDKKRLIISNTVAAKIDTKDLKRPFFRGDQARSNADGAGLGLSIAERAAALNGFSLKLTCNDTEFRAEVKF